MASNDIVGAYFDFNKDLLRKAVTVCELHKIHRVRLSEPDIRALDILTELDVNLSLDIPNFMLMGMARNNSVVEDWFNKYIKAFSNHFTFNYIVVGQEGDDNILPVMSALQNLLNANNLQDNKLTTLVSYNTTLVVKEPTPSNGTFYPDLEGNMRDILQFLLKQGYPLMVGVYPYNKYVEDNSVSQSYATFGASTPVVRDGPLDYYNLFDAMVDTFYATMEKVGAKDVTLIVGEIGWPTSGHANKATVALASEYNKKLKTHISSQKGTPRKPNVPLQVFIRSLFDGDQSYYGVFDKVSLKPIYPPF